MNLLRNAALLFVAVLVLYSCKKSADDELKPAVTTNSAGIPGSYSNLAIGNYWVYQLFDMDSTGAASATTTFDSAYVDRDTIIRGNTYHELVKVSPTTFPSMSASLLRDSADCIVDYHGQICFSSTDFTSIFNLNYRINVPGDTVYKSSGQMFNETNTVNVPAGAFVVMNYKTTYIMYHSYSGGGYWRYLNARYCKNIGLVSETLPFYASVPYYKERRLVRYHVN